MTTRYKWLTLKRQNVVTLHCVSLKMYFVELDDFHYIRQNTDCPCMLAFTLLAPYTLQVLEASQ